MESLPKELLLLTSSFLNDEDKKHLAQSSNFLFWELWDVSSCYWHDPFPMEEYYCVVHENDFKPFAGRPLLKKPCTRRCLGLEWCLMCDECKAYEDAYYNNLYQEEDSHYSVDYNGRFYDDIFEY